MSTSAIQGIFIGGFQVIDKPVFIPLGRLTLLFGPNSAGKSAIEDAFGVIEELFTKEGNNAWDQESWTRFGRFERHWRRLGDGVESYVPELTLGVRFGLDCALAWALGNKIGQALDDNCGSLSGDWDDPGVVSPEFPFTIDLRVTYVLQGEPGGFLELDNLIRKKLSIVINGHLLAESNEVDAYFKIDFSHPVLRCFKLQVDFAQMARRHPKVFSFKDGVVKIRGASVGTDHHLCIPGLVHGGGFRIFFDHDDKRYQEIDLDAYDLKDVREALYELERFHNGLYDLIRDEWHFPMSVVSASRTIPTNKDLSFLINVSGLGDYGLGEIGDSQFRRLAKSFADSVYSDIESTDAKRKKSGTLHQMINRMLSEHLFVERGYRLNFEHQFILMPDDYRRLAGGAFDEDLCQFEPGILLRIFLSDAQQRGYSFDEVGSGLGYVLPILCAACDRPGDHERSAFTLLHQPELHLHPALQAALGDVLIECATHGKQLIIETHSEHMLLRILKRIRQTHGDKPLAPELKLRPEDVSVFYFDPAPDGVTHIRHLRISEDGDFLDRWPRGFFAERDGELFDE